MAHYNAHRLIEEVTEALTGSVPRKHYNEVLAALSRCREMIANLATVVAEIDKEQKHGELMLEAKLYASIIGGLFSEAHRGPFETNWADIKSGFNPREYLKDKGVIKPDLKESLKKAAVEAEELAKELTKSTNYIIGKRKAQRAEYEQKVNELIAQITRKPKKRGRPIGSKNKPKAMTIDQIEATLPKQTARPVHKPRTKYGRKVGNKNKPKTGGVK